MIAFIETVTSFMTAWVYLCDIMTPSYVFHAKTQFAFFLSWFEIEVCVDVGAET
jgi:hypothetical protein